MSKVKPPTDPTPIFAQIGVRDVPDVSLFASNGVYNSAYIVCSADSANGLNCDPSAPPTSPPQ